MVKLDRVPIITYSVIFTSLAFVSSPKRKIDLAASRNPMPSIHQASMKVRIKTLSK